MEHPAVVVLLASVVAGCSATITLGSGRQVDGTVVSGDAQKVYMKISDQEIRETFGDEQALLHDDAAELRPVSAGQPLAASHEIRRDAIADVDHPGFAAGVTGTVVTAVGTGLVVWGLAEIGSCAGDICGIHHAWSTIPGVVIAVAGIATMIPGWVIYTDSQSAMAPKSSEATAKLVPVATIVDDEVHAGVVAAARW